MNQIPKSSTVTGMRLPNRSVVVAGVRPSAFRPEQIAEPNTSPLASANRVSLRPGDNSSKRSLLTKRDQLMFVTQLSIMLRAGVDLAEAVRSVAKRSASANVKAAIGGVYEQIESGKLLSQALMDNQQHFSGVLIASVAAGEASGRLPDVLSRLSTIIRDELRLRSSIRGAISYPIVLMFVTALVLSAMIFFVLPQFGGIYAASRAPTPAITQLLLDSATFARKYWLIFVAAAALAIASGIQFVRSSTGRRYLDRVVLRLPFAQRIWSALLAGRMFRLQGMMLSSGVPMLDVLRLTKSSVNNHCFCELVDQVESSVVNGRGMSAVLSLSTIIPNGAADMIATAEANGELGNVLQTVGEFFESEGEQHLRDAVKIAEPAIIVIVGLVVGAIVLAVMLPMLDLSTAGAM